MEQTPDEAAAPSPNEAVALNVEYAIEVARGAGLTAEQLQVLGDMLRRHAGTRELIELRWTIAGLLATQGDAERGAQGDGNDRQPALGVGG